MDLAGKIAMDIVAKHIEDHIGMLDEISYREQLWGHKPLSDFWRIGSRTERKLAGYGIQTMGDIALASIQSEDWLYKMFGIDAELLIDHAWGCESCKMSDIKNYHTEEHSLSNGQVLMRNYTFEEATVVVREMTDQDCLQKPSGKCNPAYRGRKRSKDCFKERREKSTTVYGKPG